MIVNPNKPRNKKEAPDTKNETVTEGIKKIEKEQTIIRSPKNKSRVNHGPQKNLGGGFAIRIIVYAVTILASFILLGMVSVIFMVGPVVSKEKALPEALPTDIPLYLPQQASIKTQNQDQRQKLIHTIESLPNWFITPFLSRFSVDLKGQILLGNEKEAVYDAVSLKKSLEASLENKLVISLRWRGLGKNRKDLEDYYIKKLQTSGFSIKTEDRKQETMIIFEKDKVKGIFLITDNFISQDSSNISLVVTY